MTTRTSRKRTHETDDRCRVRLDILCGHCDMPYTRTGNRTPRVFECGHTMCYACAKGFFTSHAKASRSPQRHPLVLDTCPNGCAWMRNLFDPKDVNVNHAIVELLPPTKHK